MGFITQEGFHHLDTYKYVSGGYSFLDNYINYYWEAVVKLLPMVYFNFYDPSHLPWFI